MRALKTNAEKLYWLIPLLVLIFQAVYSNQALVHIRQEELTESVSNVYWLQKGSVCSGITSNIGWYYQLMFVYNIFGFSLAIVKIYKLLLVAISLFCLASILKNFLGVKRAWLPLLTIGLSPTLIYFNSLSIHYGMDLIYFPICLFLVLGIKFNFRLSDYLRQITLWVVAMVAWMSYPTFISYLPILLALFIYKSRNRKRGKQSHGLRIILINIVAFFTPLILGILYVKNKSMLFYDPRNQSGIFRGNGGVNFDLKIVWENIQTTFFDLFYAPSSYYFEIAKVEFSDIYPVISILTVFFILIYFAFKKKSYRPALFLLIIYLFLNIILTSLTGTIGGIRRATSVLAIFYGLFCFAWYLIFKLKDKSLRYLLMAFLSLILLHHLLAYPANLQFLKIPSNYREGAWFYTDKTPQKSLDNFVTQVQKEDLSLICVDENRQPVKCHRFGYNLIYPAVAGSCLWNNLYCHQVKIYDFNRKQIAPLNLECWRDDL